MTTTFTIDDIELVPRYGVLESRSEAKLRPFIFSAPMDTVTGHQLAGAMLQAGEQPVVCRFLPAAYKKSLADYHANPNCWFAVGNLESLKSFLTMLEEVNHQTPLPDNLALNIAVDIAHGDSVVMAKVASYLVKLPFVKQLMSGSVCTVDGALRMVDLGCQYVRVGVGPGAACTTRLQTGFGTSQAYSVESIARALDGQAQVIADGGIRRPGDACKYLALGADHIMLGRALSRTIESAGWEPDAGIRVTPGGLWIKDGEPTLRKRYRGQASASFQTDHHGKASSAPEGATSDYFEPSGTVKEVVAEYHSALRSAISYSGHTSLDEYVGNVQYMRATPTAAAEAQPHGIQ
jgi:IMP dehydrogenase/GMP reductase